MITVWAVMLYDRHVDDVLTIFASKQGADAEVERIKAQYGDVHSSGVHWRWNARAHTWTSYDDGPSIRVEHMEVQP